MSDFKKISFVIPCYRSENTVLLVVDEIEETMAKRPELLFEIVLVNDGSPDDVWSVIRNRCREDNRVIGVNLSKNFGQHSALMAGYGYATGDCVVSLDDDGQTPASEVFALIDELDKGYDVVYASYPETKQNMFRRWGSNFAKKVTDYMYDVKDDRKGSSYYAVRKYIIDEVIKYEHSFPYISGLFLRATRNIGMVTVTQRERFSGKSNYSLKKLFRLWLSMVTAFSVKPIELGAFVGMGLSVAGGIYAIVLVILKLCDPTREAGWSSLMAVMLIVGGFIIIMLGLVGEYVGRIYMCINRSPQYVIKELVNYEIKEQLPDKGNK